MTAHTITKESDAWFALAKLYDKHGGDTDPIWETRLFLCDVIMYDFAPWGQQYSAQLSEDLRTRMVARIELDLGHKGPAYGHDWSTDPSDWPEQKNARVLAALMFGWEAKTEETGR